MKNIVLIGMPGCGKTTIGKLLSDQLNIKYCGIDEYIEKSTGKTIPEIFKNGEERFRRIEREAVKEISKEENTVIATGGGVIKYIENIDNLRKSGIIVYINRPLENIIEDIDIDNRPLIKDKKEKLYTLYEERYLLYKEYCDYEVMNTGSLQEVTQKIIGIIKNDN
ncbi:MAG: shikimate kinase [Tissierella sp.]|nr:shikimate kinase [Tissierella sp.]